MRLINGWIFFNQKPLNSPENPPMAKQAPMLGIYPATEDIAKPPEIVPTRLYLTPTLPLPKIKEEIYVQITLAVIAKYMFKGPR